MNETMTLIEKTVFLKSVEVFGGIPTEALAQLASRSAESHLDAGQTLFLEGDEDQGVLIVVQGLVELRKGDAIIRLLKDGTAHGELFLRGNEPLQYTAIAREDTHLLTLGRSDVLDALVEYPEFGLAMVQDLALRHHRLTERVIELEKRLEQHGGSEGTSPQEAIEPPAATPQVPQRRGWWRLAARPRTKPTSSS